MTTTPRRVPLRNKVTLFSDPAKEEQLAELLQQTQRTALVMELMGLGAEHHLRLKSHMNRVLKELGIAATLPRGTGRNAESRSFMVTKGDRMDGAMLVAIHFGTRGPGEFSEPDSNLYTALQKLLESYYRYQADMYPNSEPLLDFESWVALVRGIRSRIIEVHTCRDCGSAHPVRADELGEVTCPVCFHLNLDMENIRRSLANKTQAHKKSAAAGTLRVLAQN